MFTKDGRRFNVYSGAVIDGVRYANFTDPALREQLGITEVADPAPPAGYLENPDHYYVTEQDDAPFVVYTRKSDEQIAAVQFAKFDAALTEHLNKTAQDRRYDDRITCMVRAGFPGPFQAEAIAFATWCDGCNAMAYVFMSEVQAGTRPMPDSPQALIDALPVMEWPN